MTKIINGDELFDICERLQQEIASFQIGNKSFAVYDTSVLSERSKRLLARSNAQLQRFFEPIIKLQQRQEAGESVSEQDYQSAALVGLQQDSSMLSANIDYIAAHTELSPDEISEAIESKLNEMRVSLQKTTEIDGKEIEKRLNLQKITYYGKLSMLIRQEIQAAQDSVSNAIASISPAKNIPLLESSEVQPALNSHKKDKVNANSR